VGLSPWDALIVRKKSDLLREKYEDDQHPGAGGGGGVDPGGLQRQARTHQLFIHTRNFIHHHVPQFPYFFRYNFLGDLQYFIMTPHWMCTNVRRPLRFSSSLLRRKGTPRQDAQAENRT